MFKNIYVKKLWSDNPVQYKLITLDVAISGYGAYCACCAKSPYSTEPKSFQEWLASEI